MAIVTKPVARILVTPAQLAEAQATWDRCELAEARVAALRDALAAAIRRERAVGGYCSHEDQQARREAEALVVETEDLERIAMRARAKAHQSEACACR